MSNTPQSQQEMKPAKNTMAMAALIIFPLLLSSFLWLVMPSGYRHYKMEVKDSKSLLSGWHPMQPALKQAFQIINP
jgi:hypothetical protein